MGNKKTPAHEAEIAGARDACEICRDPDKPVCYTLKILKMFGITNYTGKCGRDVETGIYKEKCK
jgi:hypothetical protein